MRFQIPQFIDVEDKIFGPFTLKQFIYLAGGASAGLVAIVMFGLFFGLLLASPVILLALALAFYKINNRPFIHTLESAFKYATKDKLYIWKKSEPKIEEGVQENKKYSSLVVPNISQSRLKDMNWMLDIKKGEEK
jgi:hypothetical protein